MSDAHGEYGHNHTHDHHHGHANDQGWRGALRYLRWLPEMWHSEVNDAIVDLVQLQPGDRVVDIGAGLGAGTIRAAATGAHLISVEPTPYMRRMLVARRLINRRRRNIEPVDGAAESIPAANDSVDVVFAVNTMHHWVDVERGVAEIARVVKPGGRILLVDEAFTDPSHPEHDRFGGDGDLEHHGFTMVDAEELVGLLRGAGIADVAVVGREIAGRPVVGVSAGLPDLASR